MTKPTQLVISEQAKEYPEPTPEDLSDPLLESIWQAIKGWDISRGRPEHLYSGPTGNDVMHILNVVRPHLNSQREAIIRECADVCAAQGIYSDARGLVCRKFEQAILTKLQNK